MSLLLVMMNKYKLTNSFTILSGLAADGPIPRANTTWYCKCSKCKLMEMEEESVCCQEVRMNPELLLGKSRLVLLVYISKIFFL